LTEPAVIDSHHHVWDLSVREQPWTAPYPSLHRSFVLDDLRPALRRGNVTGTVLIQTVTLPAETPELLALAAAEPVVAGVVGWAELDAPGIGDRLAELRSLPGSEYLAGIRHPVQEEPDLYWLCRPAVRRGLGAVGAAGLAYDLLVTAAQLPAAVATVRALPDMRFVLDHAGSPPPDPEAGAAWRRDILELARAENVTVKLSGLLNCAYPEKAPPDLLRSWTDTLLKGFGPQRMMYGSDWPVCTLTTPYDNVLATARELAEGLSAAERHALFAGTASRFYRVTTASSGEISANERC
jgi:L-fuconolactonase